MGLTVILAKSQMQLEAILTMLHYLVGTRMVYYLCLLSHPFLSLVSPVGFSSISPANNVTLNRGDDITLWCNTTAGPDNLHNWFHKATEQVCCPNGEDVNVTGRSLLRCGIF